MENNRFLFRAVVKAKYCDSDGKNKTIKLLLNRVAVYSPTTIGVTDEILVNAIRNTNLNAKERNSVYSYFKANNECSDSEWFILEAETIEQCIGVKDTNGKFIFEGDIINDPTWWWGPGYVFLSMGKCGPCRADNVDEYILSKNISNSPQDAVYNEWNGDEVTVIGNIHENPELLEEKMGIKDLFKRKVVKEIIKETVYKEPEIRDGWFVYEAGQNPLCYYWYCTLCSFNLKDKDGYARTVSVEDCTTFNQAVEQANKLAEELENGSKN